MGAAPPISEATTHRLSLLLRALRALEVEKVDTVSSRDLEERFGLNSAQIRKDLAHFGEFGVRGVGYRVAVLKSRLSELMGLSRAHTIVVLGAGNLGQALADSRNFNSSGFKVVALFDTDGRKVGGKTKTGVPIRATSEMPGALAKLKPDIGVLAIPPEAVPEGARALADAGLPAILNFAPATVPPLQGTIVKNVDLTLFLESLSFQLGAGRTSPRK